MILDFKLLIINSEWLVKDARNQSSIGIGQNSHKGAVLGQEVYSGRIIGSDLSPYWSNIAKG
jgi:hypothetical protein